jgi:tRNA threonylcarbamoyladenosine biosynthesis protein TsaE
MVQISNNEEETAKIAAEVAKKVQHGGVVCLYGDLGSGKTVFTKGIAEALDLQDFKVKSLTYTYIRAYENFYHIDLYRLEAIDELLLHEIEELWENPNNILVIEWADRLAEHLPPQRTDVHIEYRDENTRTISIDSSQQ